MYSLDALAVIMIGSSLFLYWMFARQLTGAITLQMEMGEEWDPGFAFGRKAAEGLVLTILYLAGSSYALISMFALPYVLISLWAEIFCLLIYAGIIEVVEADPEDDES